LSYIYLDCCFIFIKITLFAALNDYIFNGHDTLWLDFFSVTTLLFGIAVVINKNPIASLLCLIGLFGTIASYLIFIGLTFIGLSYLIVYIGAVSILFLFILMLINIRTSELQSNNSNSIPLALFITIVLDYILFEILPYQIAVINNSSSKIGNFFAAISGG
jgi:NADH-ubiquinone oxidoreductase chain 6